MRKYDQLSKEEQDRAQDLALSNLLEAITSSEIRFDDKLNKDDLQARIDKAGQKAEDMFTPWFASEYIMDTCKEDLTAMSTVDAEDSLYPDTDERIIRL